MNTEIGKPEKLIKRQKIYIAIFIIYAILYNFVFKFLNDYGDKHDDLNLTSLILGIFIFISILATMLACASLMLHGVYSIIKYFGYTYKKTYAESMGNLNRDRLKKYPIIAFLGLIEIVAPLMVYFIL